MAVGDELRALRKKAGYTQTEMAAGIVSESFYSKVERGVHKIDVDTLFEILFAHRYNPNFDISRFLNNILHTWAATKKKEGAYVNMALAKLSSSVNNLDLEGMKQAERELEKQGPIPPAIKHIIMASHLWLERDFDSIPLKTKREIKRMYNLDDWTLISYSTLAQDIIFLDPKDAYNLTNSAFDAYKKSKDRGGQMYINVGLLAVNFLRYAWYHKLDKEYVKNSLDVLDSLPNGAPELVFYRLAGAYFKAIFDNDLKTARGIADALDAAGHYKFVTSIIREIDEDA